MLQASSDLIEAAWKGQVQRVKALLLNHADPEARNELVSYSSCICIFSNDFAYIACARWTLINVYCCSECQVRVSCLMWQNTVVHNTVVHNTVQSTVVHTVFATMLAMLAAKAFVTQW